MRQYTIVGTMGLLALSVAERADAQLITAGDSRIVNGHYHLNVTDPEQHKDFWVDTLGGTPLSFGGMFVVKFADILIFIQGREPSRGTKETTVNHLGFTVPNLKAFLDNVETVLTFN